jgi:hypothetical protein
MFLELGNINGNPPAMYILIASQEFLNLRAKKSVTHKQLQKHQFRMISQYLESGKTQRAFIAEQGISLTGFRYWLNKYRIAHSKPAVTNKNSFVEVIPSIPAVKESLPGWIDIIFPNGVRVNLSSESDGSFLSKVIKSW